MAAMFPTLVLFLAVVIGAVPWGLPGEATFIPPFVTFLLVFLFSAQRKYPLPAVVVFLAGLTTDVLTAGPLGYWAIVYLLGHVPARMARRRRAVHSLSGLWGVFIATTALAASAGWAIASLYYLRLIDWWPIALGALVAVALFPILASWRRRSLAMGRYRLLDVRA